jgi:hypothetical protein
MKVLIFGMLTVITVLVVLYVAYSIKVKLGINLNVFGDKHFPCYIQKFTKGIVKCEWFPNGHHCKCED